MILRRVVHKEEAKRVPLENTCFLDERIGAWANVISVDSTSHSCEVITDTGIIVGGIPVMTNEWVSGTESTSAYVSGERNLPPIGSRVFILMPTKNYTGALIIGSGYTLGDKKAPAALLASDEATAKIKNTVKEKVTSGGWTEKEDYTTGNRSLESDILKGALIKLLMNLANDDEGNLPGIKMTAFINKIEIDSKGISITDCNQNKILLNASGITVTDINTNNVAMTASGITVTDINKNNVAMTASGITVTDINKNTVTINGNGLNIKDLKQNEITLQSNGIKIKDFNNNELSMKSTGVEVKTNNNQKLVLGNNSITISDMNGNTIETNSSSVEINGKLKILNS